MLILNGGASGVSLSHHRLLKHSRAHATHFTSSTARDCVLLIRRTLQTQCQTGSPAPLSSTRDIATIWELTLAKNMHVSIKIISDPCLRHLYFSTL